MCAQIVSSVLIHSSQLIKMRLAFKMRIVTKANCAKNQHNLLFIFDKFFHLHIKKKIDFGRPNQVHESRKSMVPPKNLMLDY